MTLKSERIHRKGNERWIIAADAGLNDELEMYRIRENVIDRFHSEVTRFFRLQDFHTRLGFLLGVQNIVLRNFEDKNCKKSFWLRLANN